MRLLVYFFIGAFSGVYSYAFILMLISTSFNTNRIDELHHMAATQAEIVEAVIERHNNLIKKVSAKK